MSTTNHDDAVSVNSKSSSAHDSLNSTDTHSSLDTLKLIAGSHVRRSKCRATYLEQLAKNTEGLAAFDKEVAERLKIIAGKEGVSFFRKYIGDEPLEVGLNNEEEKERLKKWLSDPVVFAVCVMDAGRKVVDYYMTWRGKTRVNHLPASQRKESFLDEEFRRVRKSIDRSYDCLAQKDSSSHTSDKSKKRRSSPSPHRRSPLPPHITVSPPSDPVKDAPSPITPISKRVSSPHDSVTSLPFLGAIRNVPLSNRIPLRVTNPDRYSFAESTNTPTDPVTQMIGTASLDTLVEAPESAENAARDTERRVNVDGVLEVSDADQRRDSSRDKRSKIYPESLSSAGSRSSKAGSRSKSHHKHRDGTRSRKSSSSRRHHSSPGDKSEHDHSSTPRHKDKDDDGHRRSETHHHHHHHHHHSSRHHRSDEDGQDGDEKSKHRHERKDSSTSKKSMETDITLVMVDPDEVDRVSMHHEVTKQPQQLSKSGTWHGHRQLIRRATKPGPAPMKPQTVQTGWYGPRARESHGVQNIRALSAYSDGDDDWEDVAGNGLVITPSDDESDDESSLLPLKGHAPSGFGLQAPSISDSSSSSSSGHLPGYLVPRGVPPVVRASPYTSGYSNQLGAMSPASATHSASSQLSMAYSGLNSHNPGMVSLSIGQSPASSNSSVPSAFVAGYVSSMHPSPVGSNVVPGVPVSYRGPSPYLYASPRASPFPACQWVSPHSMGGVDLSATVSPGYVTAAPSLQSVAGYVAQASS